MQQAKEEQYEILPSAAILDRMQKLVADYPTFASLTTAQEWFGLPRAGEFDIAVKILNDIDGHNYGIFVSERICFLRLMDVNGATGSTHKICHLFTRSHHNCIAFTLSVILKQELTTTANLTKNTRSTAPAVTITS